MTRYCSVFLSRHCRYYRRVKRSTPRRLIFCIRGTFFEILERASVHDLMASMPLHRFHSIRHLRLARYPYARVSDSYDGVDYTGSGCSWGEWEKIWEIVATMKNLVTLKVEIRYYPCRPLPPDQEKDLWENRILAALWKVQGPRVWIVSGTWQESDLRMDGAPFYLRRIA